MTNNSAPPEPPPTRSRSWLPISLALVAAAAIFAAFWLLTMGFFGFVLAAILATGGIIALHYFIWGWWLSEIIRREEEAEDENE